MYNAHLIITYMFLKEKLQKLKKCSEIPIHSVVKKPPKKPQNPATQNILQQFNGGFEQINKLQTFENRNIFYHTLKMFRYTCRT